jgi:hypothetical protein
VLLHCTIWVHFKRNYNLFDQVLINVVTFVFFSLYELGRAHVIFELIVITSYCKLDPSWPIFDHMNGSLFDEFTNYRLNISKYLLFKTTIIRVKNNKQTKTWPLHRYHFHCCFELVFKLNISDKLSAFTKQLIFVCKI